MDKGYIVLEEKLVEAFFDFYEDKGKVDKDLKMRLFKFLKPFNITREQLEKYYKKFADLPDELKVHELTENQYWFVVNKELYQNINTTDPFSEEIMKRLVTSSNYKILLVSVTSTNPPFKEMNINASNIQFPYTEKITTGKSRENARIHIIELMKGASKIEIIDRYCDKVLTKIQDLLKQANCIGISDITIYTERTNNMSFSLIDKKIKIQPYKDKLHDRYLIINNKTEIILTSGFEHLFDDKKELTYIITEK